MRISILGYGLVRGREPEFCNMATGNTISIIGFNKPGKMHESGICNASTVELIFPRIYSPYMIDPTRLFGQDPECTSWIYFDKLKEILKGSDLIITHELWNFFSYQTVKIAKSLGIPCVVVAFETIKQNPIFSSIYPYSRNTHYVARNADRFIAQTQRARDYLESLDIPKEKITLCYPGVDLETFQAGVKADHERTVFLFIGNYDQKGLDILLSALEDVSKKRKDIELWVVGTGPESLVERLHQDGENFPIKVLGKVPHQDIPGLMRSADVFCVLSRDRRVFNILFNEEQFGYALVEAMASGLPILSTKCGSIPEVIGDQNLIAEQENVDQVKEAINKLADSKELRQRIGAQNRLRCEKMFDSRKQTEELLRIVNSLLG